jgi:hypothetical protein
MLVALAPIRALGLTQIGEKQTATSKSAVIFIP